MKHPSQEDEKIPGVQSAPFPLATVAICCNCNGDISQTLCLYSSPAHRYS